MNFFRALFGTSTGTGFTASTLAGLKLHHVRDVNGFDHGVVYDAKHCQATTVATVAGTQPTKEQWEAFETAMAADKGLIAMAIAHDGEATTVGMTFRATEPKDRKDYTEFLTRLARQGAGVLGAGDDNGIELHPMDKEALTHYVASLWGGGDQFPPTADTGAESWQHITVAGITRALFDVDLTVDGIDERFLAWANDEAMPVAYTRLFRPAQKPDGDGPGRFSGIATITADSVDELNGVAAGLIRMCPARQRLRIHRMLGRQQIGLWACAGVGVLPWQHLNLIEEIA
ncbi:hypothetical protein ACR3EC_11545 [Corynebacterium diphtheriae]|nr:hypothetical protein B9J72_11520 [Corynebacterium diphtheriae]